ncbi:hypothetical protein Bbelb_376440 [Branchiostoma belcheri]|nr:hypothetical protein Bbelb_376440 [Branchiostoma belcheri]
MAEVTAISEGGSDVPPSQHPEVPPSFPDSDTPPPAQSTVQSDSQAGNTCANGSPANQNLSCTDVNSITSISLEEPTGNKHGGSSNECVEEKLEKDEGSTNTGKCTANPHSHGCTDGNSISLEKQANKHGGSSGNCKEELRKDGGNSNECVGEKLGTDGGSANTGKCTNEEPPHTCAAPGEELPHTCPDEHLQEAGETSPGWTPEEQYENLYTCLQVARMPGEFSWTGDIYTCLQVARMPGEFSWTGDIYTCLQVARMPGEFRCQVGRWAAGTGSRWAGDIYTCLQVAKVPGVGSGEQVTVEVFHWPVDPMVPCGSAPQAQRPIKRAGNCVSHSPNPTFHHRFRMYYSSRHDCFCRPPIHLSLGLTPRFIAPGIPALLSGPARGLCMYMYYASRHDCFCRPPIHLSSGLTPHHSSRHPALLSGPARGLCMYMYYSSRHDCFCRPPIHLSSGLTPHHSSRHPALLSGPARGHRAMIASAALPSI